MSSLLIGGVRSMAALLAVLAMVYVSMAPTLSLAAENSAIGESCVDCAGCETRECGVEGENPLAPHHHCCITACLSHVAVAITKTGPSVTPATVTLILAVPAIAFASRDPETPFRPPRA